MENEVQSVKLNAYCCIAQARQCFELFMGLPIASKLKPIILLTVRVKKLSIKLEVNGLKPRTPKY